MIGTTAALIAGGIMAGGSVASGALGARAAGKAAKQQKEAAIDAGNLVQKFGQIGHDEIVDASLEARKGVTEAVEKGQGILGDVYGEGKKTLSDVYGTGIQYLNPYLEAGEGTITQLTDLLAPGGEFNRRFSTTDYQEDPGYDFRMKEGQKALERSASARGTLLGGGQLKALTRYSQGVASQEYQNAFERFQAENAARFGRLATVSGMGQTATGQANQLGEWYGGTKTNLGQWYGGTSVANLMQGAKYGGDYRLGGVEAGANMRFRGAEDAANALTGAGNAAAAGTVGAANAWGQGIGGAANSIYDAVLLSQLLNPKPVYAPKPAGGYDYKTMP